MSDPRYDAAPVTAFPATARAVRDAFGDASLDAASFARPLAPCDLRDCRGTCCTEGVTLNAEEAMVLRALVRREGDALRALAPAMPEQPIVSDDVGESDEEEDAPARTALVPRAYHGVVAGYPPHFHDAACAFLMPDARCALQALADLRGRPSWYWKPLACWLHPIALDGDTIRLPDAASDRHGTGGTGGFASCTPCGRTASDGRPGAEVLAAELRALGGLLGRDLLIEARVG
ncbi:MAG: hypothetical protein ACXW61_10745 [Gemmatirosa sp.]